MTARRTFILIALLLASAFGRAEATGENPLSSSDYRAELDRLSAATQQLDSSGKSTPSALHGLPETWHVRAGDQDFDISTYGLQQDVRRYESDKNVANALAIRARIKSLRDDLDGFEKPPVDVSSRRTELNSILSRPEFGDVRGPNWLDHLKLRIIDFLIRILRRMFGSTSIPTISKYFVYGLMAVALLALLYIAYRTIWRGQEVAEVIPRDLPVSAKEWAIWLQEARAAAAKGDWRDAVHLAYWAGISFLERQGFWKPDRARTPREYLRLLSSSSDKRETLATLTRIFELTWYAKREASEGTFSETLAELEKLGCR